MKTTNNFPENPEQEIINELEVRGYQTIEEFKRRLGDKLKKRINTLRNNAVKNLEESCREGQAKAILLLKNKYKDKAISAENKTEKILAKAVREVSQKSITVYNQVKREIETALKKGSESGRNVVMSAKEYLIETWGKKGEIACIEYSSGARVPFEKYAAMAARTANIEAENAEYIIQAEKLGTNLVQCIGNDITCEVCAQYRNKIYCTDGKDKRFPPLRDSPMSPLKKGYDTIHPNCRCQFLPYFEENHSKEETENLERESNKKLKDSRTKRQAEKYQEWQIKNRQLNAERNEYQQLKKVLGNEMPYKTLASYRRARRAESSAYIDARKAYNNLLEKTEFHKETAYNYKVVDDVSYKDKFHKIGSKNSVDIIIKNEARKCIIENNMTKNERVVILDYYGKEKRQVITGKNQTVYINSEYFTKSKNNSLILVHNHPMSTSFSFEDIITLSANPQIRTMIVAAHDGTVYTLSIGEGKRLDRRDSMIYNDYEKEFNGNLNLVVKKLAEIYNWRYRVL